MKEARKMALCGMMAALSVVLMIVGAALELGMYASPVLAGLCLASVRQEAGVKFQIITWLSVSLISFMLVNNIEQNLMYFGVFGCYPILRPWLQDRPRGLRMLLKGAFFNGVVIGLEALVMLVLAPESLGYGMLIALLAMGNLLFVVYDYLIPRYEMIIGRYVEKALGRGKRGGRK